MLARMGKKQKASFLKDMVRLGKSRAETLGIQFNTSFQPGHRYKLEKNHWKEFLVSLGLGQEPHPDCKECSGLLSEALMSIEDAATLVPFEGRSLKPKLSRSLASSSGAKRGRKAKTDEKVNLWEWLDENRPDQYERASAPEDKVQKVRCKVCSSTITVRESNTWFILQHEGFEKHKEAMSNTMCEGLVVSQDHSLPSVQKYFEAFEVWALVGFPWYSTANKHSCFMNDAGSVVVRCQSCEKVGHRVRPEKDWCLQCEKLCKLIPFVHRVCRWSFRILLVDLVHATLTENEAARESLLVKFEEREFLQADCTGEDVNLRALSYEELFEFCKLKIHHISKDLCNAAGVTFIESRFSWLSGKKLSFAAGPHAATLKSVSKALMTGALPQEIRLAEHILNGSLRSDSVLKTLVTSMVMKCTRHTSARPCRSSFDGIDSAEMAEAGFALSTCSQVDSVYHHFSIDLTMCHSLWFNVIHLEFIFSMVFSRPQGYPKMHHHNISQPLTIYVFYNIRNRFLSLDFTPSFFWLN